MFTYYLIFNAWCPFWACYALLNEMFPFAAVLIFEVVSDCSILRKIKIRFIYSVCRIYCSFNLWILSYFDGSCHVSMIGTALAVCVTLFPHAAFQFNEIYPHGNDHSCIRNTFVLKNHTNINWFCFWQLL